MARHPLINHVNFRTQINKCVAEDVLALRDPSQYMDVLKPDNTCIPVHTCIQETDHNIFSYPTECCIIFNNKKTNDMIG